MKDDLFSKVFDNTPIKRRVKFITNNIDSIIEEFSKQNEPERFDNLLRFFDSLDVMSLREDEKYRVAIKKLYDKFPTFRKEYRKIIKSQI